MNKEQNYLLNIISHTINDTVAEVPSEEFDWQYFYDYAKENQFDHIVYKHLVALGMHDEANPIMHSFHQRYGRAIVHDNMQDMELAELSEALSGAKIPHIPLKGSVIKRYYPFPDIRRSGDIDILIHDEDIEKADVILKTLGYECNAASHDVHDSYTRGKTHIEMHNTLTDDNDCAYNFCLEVWNHSTVKENYLYEMNLEFLYAYLLVHLRRHLTELGGGGIKLILDLWMLNKQLTFDEEKLSDFLEQAHITNLRIYAEALSRNWFGGEECDDENVLMLEDLIMNSGAYGNYSTYLDMRLSRSAGKGFVGNKIKNFIQLMCPPLKSMKNKYPILNKYPVLLPFSWIKRVFDAHGDHTKAVTQSVGGLSKEEAKRLNKFCENINS